MIVVLNHDMPIRTRRNEADKFRSVDTATRERLIFGRNVRDILDTAVVQASIVCERKRTARCIRCNTSKTARRHAV